MNVDTHPIEQQIGHATAATAPHGPFSRIVAVSLATGLATALTLSLVVFAGHTEATITGALLAGFALGWALIGVLSSRFTDRSQRWAAVPAVAMSATGLGLAVFTPQNGAMTAMSWIWPAPCSPGGLRLGPGPARPSGRARWLLVPVVAVLAVAPVAATYETSASSVTTTSPPPPAPPTRSRQRLGLDCRGQGSPTVVLDNGLGEVTASWASIVPRVDTTTRVCAKDRAGQEWSQVTRRSRTA